MHINSHYLLGMIVGITAYYYFQYPFIIILLIVGAAVAQDGDFLLSKWAPLNNHRRLFTHSIWPTVLLFLIGILMNVSWIIFATISVFTHVLVDMLDWGLNLWYNGKLIGIAILLPQKDTNQLDLPSMGYYYRKFFFTDTYMSSKGFLLADLGLLLLTIVLMVITQFPWVFLMLGYIIAWAYHLHAYISEKRKNFELLKNRIEDKKKYL